MQAYVHDRAVAHPVRRTWSRRDVLRIGGMLAAGFALGACTTDRSARPSPTRRAPHDARVVVVGAGLAGLTAAHRLARAGVDVRLFEAQERVGGRCWTARGFADDQTAEHGGEFIDTRHVHLLRLVRELGLEVDDLWASWVPGSIWPNWLDGEVVLGRELRQQLEPVAAAIRAEARRIGVAGEGTAPSAAAISHGTASREGIELDARSMAEWLDERVPGIAGSPLGDHLDATMAGWYGLEMDRLSACNWIDYFVLPWPGADERWHVRGGNDRIVDAIVDRLPSGALTLGTPLEALRRRADGVVELRFGGVPAPVAADFAILALPFTTLRLVDLDGAGFSPERLAAIRDLGMGSNVKLLLQADRRPSAFRVAGRPWSGGMEHTDPNFQTWDSSAAQAGASGLLTVYAGGRTGEGWRSDAPHEPAPPDLVADYAGHVDEVVPGTAAHLAPTGWVDRWPSDQWARGSYAAFLPGQYTRLWGFTGRAEGRVHFAGEHTSTYSQGYLNGGVESGERAAAEVMRALGVDVPWSIADPVTPAA